MKTCILIILTIFISLNGQAQIRDFGASQNTISLNFNDTLYLRIFNGIIVKNEYKIIKVDNFRYVNKATLMELGISANKPVIVMGFEEPDVDYKIDSVIYTRLYRVSDYDNPLNIHLPFCVNGKLLSFDETQKMLLALKPSQIGKITFLNKQKAMEKYHVTPFGVINLEILN